MNKLRAYGIEYVEDVKTDTDDEATRIVKRYIEISKGESKWAIKLS